MIHHIKCRGCQLILPEGKRSFDPHPKRPLELIGSCPECGCEQFDDATQEEVQDLADASELERELTPRRDDLRETLIDIAMTPVMSPTQFR